MRESGKLSVLPVVLTMLTVATVVLWTQIETYFYATSMYESHIMLSTYM